MAANYSKKTCLSNITNKQWWLIDSPKSSDKHIALEADKNLGGCVTERPIYTRKWVDKHLGNSNVYKPLTKTKAQQQIAITRYIIYMPLTKYKEDITPTEWVYIHEGLCQFKDKIARFRMSGKVHKSPWKTRPIVCCVGTSMNCLSKWLDHRLQQLKPFISTYIKDSAQLLISYFSPFSHFHLKKEGHHLKIIFHPKKMSVSEIIFLFLFFFEK